MPNIPWLSTQFHLVPRNDECGKDAFLTCELMRHVKHGVNVQVTEK